MLKVSIGLTPVLEDFDDLRLSSTKKTTKDDFALKVLTSTSLLETGKLPFIPFGSNLVLDAANAVQAIQTDAAAQRS